MITPYKSNFNSAQSKQNASFGKILTVKKVADVINAIDDKALRGIAQESLNENIYYALSQGMPKILEYAQKGKSFKEKALNVVNAFLHSDLTQRPTADNYIEGIGSSLPGLKNIKNILESSKIEFII